MRITNKSEKSGRCATCQLRKVLCICDVIPKLDLKTHVIVLMHFRELSLTTNSAKLVHVALTHGEIRLRGQMGKPMNNEGLNTPERQSVYLFPSRDAVELNAELVSSFKKPVTLIIPDGSWRQAKRVGRREPALESIPHVKLPPGPPSIYRLRREPSPEYVSTFEAIARALGILEGPQKGKEIQHQLEYLFEVMVERMLWGQGVLPKENCRFPIPPAAIEEFFIAGAKGGAKGSSKSCKKS